ncbi:hypothetical protein [Pseudoclavibacter sp. AY1H1]|uniref:helix-turn-helix transcriptional regulator n=1 Tax=Pseudoclavibacter sp. AY1H1 TaxID=2080584 RepID=UPI0011B048E3|nr:hypothetical protein [Pseudoclavibacter sp. AY1H1]
MKRYPISQTATTSPNKTHWAILMQSRIDASALAAILQDKFPLLEDPRLVTTPNEADERTVESFVVVSATFGLSQQLPRIVHSLSSQGSRVLLLTDGRSTHDNAAASLAGARASFDTRQPLGYLLMAAHMALNGHHETPTQSSTLWTSPKPIHHIRLTVTEQRVVDAIFQPNATHATVAHLLGVSVHTVNNHLANIRGKLGQFPVRNLPSLRFALEEVGLLEPYPTSTSRSATLSRDM